MHILHIYKDYFPVLGGIENHIRLLAEAQSQRGHQVTVLVTNRGRQTVEEHLNGVRVIRAGRFATIASTPLSLSLPKLLPQLQPHITHVHMPYPVGEMAQRQAGHRPYVVSYHADVTRAAQRTIMRLYEPVFQSFLRNAAGIIASTPTYVHSSPYLRHVVNRIQYVPYGIVISRFNPPSARLAQPPTILYVGQMRHYKGIDDLIRSLPRLTADARLVLAGAGPMLTGLKAICQELGLSQRVTFLGQVSDEALPTLYQTADIFVLPSNSRAESFGIVLLEAMASGLPCITTEVGSGTSYVVEHGITGLVVPPRSPDALAEALNRLLADPARRAQMGAAGRQRVLAHFTVDKMIDRVETIYHTVLGRTA